MTASELFFLPLIAVGAFVIGFVFMRFVLYIGFSIGYGDWR